MLYPAELTAHIGADEGNRTPLSSLEGWHSTNELHPHNARIIISKGRDFVNIKNGRNLKFFKKMFFGYCVNGKKVI